MKDDFKRALLVGGLASFLIASSAGGYYLWRYGPAVFRRAETPSPALPTIDAEQAARGRAAYASNCSQCHGDRAEGDPNWREAQPDGTYLPPPHDSTGHTWHHSDQLLFRIIKEGGQAVYGSGELTSRMPPFGDLLTDEEIEAVIAYFKTLWGPKERDFQASVTEQDRAG